MSNRKIEWLLVEESTNKIVARYNDMSEALYNKFALGDNFYIHNSLYPLENN